MGGQGGGFNHSCAATLKPPGPMIGAGGWEVGVEPFWAAASFRVDDGFVGEVQLSAVWPARTSRGMARVRACHARGRSHGSASWSAGVS
ncbi:MAG: hypothetical protein ACOX0T_09640 [Pelotomaculum sp.]